MFCLALTIQSDTRYLTLLRQMIAASAQVVGDNRFPLRAQQALSLALIEAVDNAIFHAHRRKRHLPIDVVLTIDRRFVRAEVSDCGKGLNAAPNDPPRGLVTRGRGLYVMRSAVSDVESIRRRNKHWMRMTYYL